MTTKKANLVGNTFGRLTVTKELPKEGRLGNKTKVTWECLCACGNYHKATTYQLRSNSVTSCGCNKPPAYEDLTGNIYGMLTVIKPSPKRSRNRQVIWISQCECGSQSEDRADLLKSGGAYSCGCTRRLNNGENLVGMVYGHLTVLDEVAKENWIWDGKHRTWLCRCICGELTKAITKNLNLGRTTHCGCISSSLGEFAIDNYLVNLDINYQREYTFSDLYYLDKNRPLRFDFAILDPNKNVTHLIEYDGAQHYNPVEYWGGEDTFKTLQKRDKLKDEYCRDKGIPLLRIPYTDYDNISDILDKYLIIIHERKIIKNA